ncbi:DUF192 domain-containing protein [Hoeflea olei]|uniref:Uncharacterized protein n=1 Tax=Hoeflea olei TaxID=1480615 RepID=A0A1C1YZB1_9HYPH|nr:DUF192 domain-containing protein [Hoeflea olei]OCW58838.1 hypothetical protein AWJ14_20860 [Hoeflea olei]
MRALPSLAAVLFAAVLLLCAGLAPAARAEVLPTDAERLVIDTAGGPVRFSVELALTPDTRATGLMFRREMAADHGMLFRFDQTRQVLMWMKNTPLPLDMVFIGEDGRVAGIAADTTPFSEDIVASPRPVRYVLELNAGTAARLGIAVGDRVRHRAILD